MSLYDKPMWRCLAAGCTGGPFAGHNATKARFHAAQVKGGGIKVCDGVLGEQLFDALVTDLHRGNEKTETTIHSALLSELAAVTHIANVAVAVEQSAQRYHAEFEGLAATTAADSVDREFLGRSRVFLKTRSDECF